MTSQIMSILLFTLSITPCNPSPQKQTKLKKTKPNQKQNNMKKTTPQTNKQTKQQNKTKQKTQAYIAVKNLRWKKDDTYRHLVWGLA